MRSRTHPFISITLLIICFFSCVNKDSNGNNQQRAGKTIQLTSTAFVDGAAIPVKYTCDSNDLSPPLKWSGAPANTRSLLLICEDPDAPVGNWMHWLIYNIPAATTELPEGVPTNQEVLEKARQGINDFKKTGYGGPCPPPGDAHHYHFRIFALDTVVGLNMPNKVELMKAIEGHVLAEGELIGTYKK